LRNVASTASVVAVLCLCARPAAAASGCHNLALGGGWTCIDTNAISGTGSNPTRLTLVHNEAVRRGDVLVAWANLVMRSGTFSSESIVLTDNAGNTLSLWAKGLNPFSNPAGQWAGGIFYAIAAADKTSGYQLTCSVSGLANCDDVSITVLRPSSPAVSLTEDGSDWVHKTTSNGMVNPPSGQTLTTTRADLVLLGGNTDLVTASADSPFIGID